MNHEKATPSHCRGRRVASVVGPTGWVRCAGAHAHTPTTSGGYPGPTTPDFSTGQCYAGTVDGHPRAKRHPGASDADGFASHGDSAAEPDASPTDGHSGAERRELRLVSH